MPILFAVVARGTTVLAKFATCAGNFTEVTEQILIKIPQENSKLTYSHGRFLFHYVTEDKIVYMCITDDEFDRTKAFMFLNDIKHRFQSQYGVRALTALPYAMNSDFSQVLASQMKIISEEKPNQVTKVENQVEELKGIMVENIDRLAERGERLELLVDKTEELNANSVSFKRTSRNLARSMWWKNVKLLVLIVVVLIDEAHGLPGSPTVFFPDLAPGAKSLVEAQSGWSSLEEDVLGTDLTLRSYTHWYALFLVCIGGSGVNSGYFSC